MKSLGHVLALLAVIFSLLTQALPCGPSYITPIFEYENAPENPYENFASGSLGIVKPTFHRSVLFTAYRYIAGNGFTPDEQKALVQVWQADFDNKNYLDTDVTEAVRTWVEKRKEVVGKDEKTPDIYVERNYAGYDFFPNCTKNAFETATETLNDRMFSHGPSDLGVLDWVKGQDEVFQNCSSGKQTPEAAPAGSAEWLQKDRAYQIAAAAFYSMDYESAKRRFAEIAEDMDSPWAETADYLVARTLVRQASLSRNKEKSAEYYEQAEQRLQKFTSSKFADSAERMLGLIAYRIHPKERVEELARKLMIPTGNANFRQDMIDYTWLMDKFEDEVLTAEERRKEERRLEEEKNSATNAVSGAEYANRLSSSNNAANIAVNAANEANTDTNAKDERGNLKLPVSANPDHKDYFGSKKANDDDIEINVYSEKESWSYYLPANSTDEDAIAEAEKLSGKSLSDEIKGRIRDARRYAYTQRFPSSQPSGHQIYSGSEKMTLSILPDYLRSEELTDWLYLYPVQDDESYLYSLSKYRQTSSDLWLMTAISKANKNSTQLMRLLDAAGKISHSSAAWQTIAYHQARLLLELGKNPEAKKLLDGVLNGPDELTVSSRNQFLDLRLKLADTLDDFLKYSLRKPFAFDFDGETGTIQEIVDRQKSYYDPKNSEGKTKEQFDREIDDQYKNELQWQDREMFDDDTITILNDHFPLSALIAVERSPVLPDYMRDRFAIAIWTRAALLEDYATAAKIAPELVRFHPEFTESISRITNARTPASRQNAVLFFILKNPILEPDLEAGMGRYGREYDTSLPTEPGDYYFS
ncbi:MAG TPA: hypothetical protein VEV84_08015, partial [Pyrinomonadaceae bacterium]|nr:hypothetical protein [Pyrinomonadaceae bacterium]